MVDWHAWIIDGLVHDSERIGLWRPAEVVDCLRPIALPAGVDFVDRADLARLRFGDQFLVVEAPPSRRVAAERLAGIGGVGAGPRLYVDDADFEDIARLGAADKDRSGADVHAEALACAAAEQLAVDRSGAAAIDALLVLGPQKHAFGARIALDHALGVVIGVVGQGLDCDVIARVDLKLRAQELAEITPMHRVGGRRQVVVGRLNGTRRALCRCWGHQRAARGPGRRRAAARHKRALEKTAALGVKFVEQLLAMKLKLRAIVIVACAHYDNSLTWNAFSGDCGSRGIPHNRMTRAYAIAPLRRPLCKPQADRERSGTAQLRDSGKTPYQ